MPSKILTMLMLLLSGTAGAHVGLENTTDVRIFPDRMEIVSRTSLPLAWAILGEQAPATTDVAGRAAALPHLVEKAADLLEVSNGGDPMAPIRTNCVFEVEDDVAFTLVFGRPTTWPVTIRAGFVQFLGDMDRGTVSVYDHTNAGYKRDMEPFIVRFISRRHPAASFGIAAPAVEKPARRTASEKKAANRMWLLPVSITALAMALYLARRRRAASA